jgi:hypothetical protein
MLSTTQRAFLDELEKISSDLMNPAVVSDSAVVDGPPPTPFTKRKGFRKLEEVGPVKEADVKDVFKRGIRKAKRVGSIVRAGLTRPGPASGALYYEIPKQIRAVGEAIAGDPASAVVPTPFTRLFTG